MTTTEHKQSRSSANMSSLQEMLDAEDSAKWAVQGHLNQYLTPPEIAREANQYLRNQTPITAIDPQCGEGSLVLNGFNWRTRKFGIDIDNRLKSNYDLSIIHGNCVDVFNVIDELYPALMFETFSANPPFGKRWKVGGAVIDSTEWTWGQAIKRGCQGVFIANHKTMERMGIDRHPFVSRYTVHENLWKQCDVVVGVAVWHNPAAKATNECFTHEAWKMVEKIVAEERGSVPKFNIYLEKDGKLKTYLSTRSTLKFKLTNAQIVKLHQINGQHPLALTVECETRRLMRALVDCGFYTVQPEAKAEIDNALAEVAQLAAPIMDVTDFERVAYTDELETLECIDSAFGFTAGKRYEMSTAGYSFTEEFTREKVHYDEHTGETYTAPHNCTLSGQDRYIQLKNDNEDAIRFMDRPRKGVPNEMPESALWQIFRKPEIKTIAEVKPEEVARNKKILKTCEMLAGYQYYPGQIEYLARVATKDHALIAAQTGTGKTLMALTLIAIKAPERALIIAPQGTMRSSEDDEDGIDYQPSQWLSEVRLFTPYLQTFQLFSLEDYNRILNANGGELPAGVYVSYFQAMTSNGAREIAPAGWDDAKLAKQYGLAVPPHPSGEPDGWARTIGKEVNGIRCIAEPCMATLIGDKFDMVLIDEAHYACNLTANISQVLIRLQPKYRYALTASPIPNVVTNLFSLMGWLCVPDWYRGDMRNAAWPYSRESIGDFENTFLSKERDVTQERLNRAANPDWRGKCEKTSPVISSPARLLKILRPTLAFISKEAVNPDYKPATVVDVRVPMGQQQSKLYGHFLDRGNIPCKHPLIRARKQIAYLRNICADPAGFEHGGPAVRSNFNPKTIAILELLADILGKGEQVVCIAARVGQSNTIARHLGDAGVRFSRIDSTVPADQHTAQSNLFKRGETRVMLMGIKCAVGHSFPHCPYEIIGSLEYSWGSLDQAKGRVDRVNSTKPRTVYCVLHKASIEEIMFDIVSSKSDAATICLRGQRIQRTFKPVDMSEVLATSISAFNERTDGAKDENEAEVKWPEIKRMMKL